MFNYLLKITFLLRYRNIDKKNKQYVPQSI